MNCHLCANFSNACSCALKVYKYCKEDPRVFASRMGVTLTEKKTHWPNSFDPKDVIACMKFLG